MTARELVEPIEIMAPPETQAGWDNSGFSVGNPDGEVSRALIALDCTPQVVAEAVEKGCDIIITHHPLIFGEVKSITEQTWLGRTIGAAIRGKITIYSAHTNMDLAAGGVSYLMAEKLGLRNCEPLDTEGYGLVGDLPVPVYAEELANQTKFLFNAEHIRGSRLTDVPVKRVAVCGGSGKSFIHCALKKGAQAYITADIPYHDFYCEDNFMILDIGHYNSEYNVVNLIYGILCKKFPNFALLISEKNNNPIYYY